MRRSRHTDDEIAFLLKEAEQGIAVEAICASAHVSIGTFYRWRRRLGGLAPAAIVRLRHIEAENGRLRAEIAKLAAMGRGRVDPAVVRHKSLQSGPIDPVERLPAVSHRSSDIAVGRFAFVRTTQ